jgi:hypothetical protein
VRGVASEVNTARANFDKEADLNRFQEERLNREAVASQSRVLSAGGS